MQQEGSLNALIGDVAGTDTAAALLGAALPHLPVTALELVDLTGPEPRVSSRAGRPTGVSESYPLQGVPEQLHVWFSGPDAVVTVPSGVLAALSLCRRRQRAEASLLEERRRHDAAEQALRASVEDVVALDVRLQEARLRRRHALELNDHIVQALAACALAMEDGRDAAAGIYLQRTLDTAKRMMTDLLDGADELDQHDLLREDPLVIAPEIVLDEPDRPARPMPPNHDGRTDRVTVLLVDDSDEIRFLLRANLESDGRFEVVGEAANGREAIDAATVLQPDAVILDASMPVMTGIDALPRLREVAPGSALIVLSAFREKRLAEEATRAGAVAYLEKGTAMADLVRVVLEHTTPPSTPPDADD